MGYEVEVDESYDDVNQDYENVEDDIDEGLEPGSDDPEDEEPEEESEGFEDDEAKEDEQASEDSEVYGKLKIGDDEIEITAENSEKIVGYIRKGYQAEQEIAQLNSQFKDFVERLKADPFSVLSNDALLGSKIEEVAARYLKQLYDREQLPAEQRRELEEREKFKKEKEEFEKQRQEIEAKRAEQKREEYRQVISNELKNNGIPVNNYTIRSVAAAIQQANNSGVRVDISRIMSDIKKDLDEITNSKLDSEKSKLEEDRKSRVAKAQSQKPARKVERSEEKISKGKRFVSESAILNSLI